MSPEAFDSRAKALPAKRSEKGYGDENGSLIESGDPLPHSPLGHFSLRQFLLGPSSRGQTLLAGASSQATFLQPSFALLHGIVQYYFIPFLKP